MDPKLRNKGVKTTIKTLFHLDKLTTCITRMIIFIMNDMCLARIDKFYIDFREPVSLELPEGSNKNLTQVLDSSLTY